MIFEDVFELLSTYQLPYTGRYKSKEPDFSQSITAYGLREIWLYDYPRGTVLDIAFLKADFSPGNKSKVTEYLERTYNARVHTISSEPEYMHVEIFCGNWWKSLLKVLRKKLLTSADVANIKAYSDGRLIVGLESLTSAYGSKKVRSVIDYLTRELYLFNGKPRD